MTVVVWVAVTKWAFWVISSSVNCTVAVRVAPEEIEKIIPTEKAVWR